MIAEDVQVARARDRFVRRRGHFIGIALAVLYAGVEHLRQRVRIEAEKIQIEVGISQILQFDWK